jgi:hypothetical protein
MVPIIHSSSVNGTMDPLSHQIMPPEMFLKDTEFFSLVIDKLDGREMTESNKRERMYGIASYRSQDGK